MSAVGAAGEKPYDERYDDGRPFPSSFAVGTRTLTWTGEIVRNSSRNTIHELKPSTTMDLAAGGLEIADLRLYTQRLSTEEIARIAQARPDSLR